MRGARRAAIVLCGVLLLLLPATREARAGIAGVGATGGDARSLATNPAAALGANGTELSVDITTTAVWLGYHRAPYAGTDPVDDPDRTFKAENTLQSGSTPSIGIRSDALGGKDSKFGMGLSLSFPTGTSLNLNPDGAGRYHMIKARSFTGYLGSAFAMRPAEGLRIGFGPILAISSLSVKKRVDLAPNLQALSPSNPPPYPEQPLLEGQFEVKDAMGFAPTFSAGAIYELGPTVTVGGSFIAPTSITVRGRSRLQPSLDFNVYSVGDFSLTQKLPPYVNLGTRVRPWAGVQLSFEGQWVGWSSSKNATLRISNSELKSDQADVDALISVLGINEGELVEGILDKDQPNPRGYQDSWNLVVGAEMDRSQFGARLETGFFKAATPDGFVNPSNVDFDNFMLGGSLTWHPEKLPFRVGLSLFQYLNQGRDVKTSRYQTHGSPYGDSYNFPSGNGEYTARITRAVVTTALKF